MLPSSLWAETRFVTNPLDAGPGSLRAAIDNAVSGDTIQFHLSLPTQVDLQSPLVVSGKSITIYGPGVPNLHISGGLNGPVFVIHGSLNISGVKIENGSGLLGACIFNGTGTLTLTDSEVYNCWGQLGGGIFNMGTLNVVNTKISHGYAGLTVNPGVGGGILNFGGTVTLTGSTVSDNSATFGGCAQGDTAQGCGGGGGIYNTANGVLTLHNSRIVANTAVDGAGLFNQRGTATLVNSTVADNTASADGGGIDNVGTVNAFGTTISGNLARGQGQPYTIIDTNGPAPSGECDPTDPTDPDCVIIYLAPSEPSHTTGGGGLRNRSGAGAVLKNTTIANNSVVNLNGAQVGGGGILATGVVYASNVTIAGNKATCIFYGTNYCDGAGIYSVDAFFKIKNSILANEPGNGNCSVHDGTFESGGHNLSDDATCAFSAVGDLNGVVAGLDPAGLADNGGPTRTVALQPTGPAVDAIPATDCTDWDDQSIAADQRGALRPQGTGCDIGAYEYFASAFPLAALRAYALVSTVNALPLDQAIKTGLSDKLAAAASAINRGDLKTAANQLRAFISQTRSLVKTGTLTPAQGTMLIAAAEAAIQMISG